LIPNCARVISINKVKEACTLLELEVLDHIIRPPRVGLATFVGTSQQRSILYCWL